MVPSSDQKAEKYRFKKYLNFNPSSPNSKFMLLQPNGRENANNL